MWIKKKVTLENILFSVVAPASEPGNFYKYKFTRINRFLFTVGPPPPPEVRLPKTTTIIIIIIVHESINSLFFIFL